MIGRLVEQQQAGPLQQQRRQADARLLAARQRRHDAVLRQVPYAETREHGFDAVFAIVAAQPLEFLAHVAVLGQRLLQVNALWVGHLRFQGTQTVLKLVHPRLGGGNQLCDRLALGRGEHLRQVADLGVGAKLDRAGVLLHLAGDNLHQRGLADAVGAHQPPLVARMHGERGAVEHLVVAIGLGEIRNGEQHRRSPTRPCPGDVGER